MMSVILSPFLPFFSSPHPSLPPPFLTPHSFSNCHFQPNNNNKSRALLLLPLQKLVVVVVVDFLQFILLRLGWQSRSTSLLPSTAHIMHHLPGELLLLTTHLSAQCSVDIERKDGEGKERRKKEEEIRKKEERGRKK